MQCLQCDLVYADSPPSEKELANAYQEAAYDSSEEANFAAIAYAKAIKPIINKLDSRNSALEIGTGTGVFLEQLETMGFEKLVGIEPSIAAINAASPHAKKWIQTGIFDESDFEASSFDLICCFMTLEHVRDPMKLCKAAFNLLKPGGAFVSVTHDYRSIVNRVLGEKSPIIDIEHMQLFSNQSISGLFSRAGFKDIQANKFQNIYPLSYWLKISPIPTKIKLSLLNKIDGSALAKRLISLNVGNTMAVGFKPNK